MLASSGRSPSAAESRSRTSTVPSTDYACLLLSWTLGRRGFFGGRRRAADDFHHVGSVLAKRRVQPQRNPNAHQIAAAHHDRFLGELGWIRLGAGDNVDRAIFAPKRLEQLLLTRLGQITLGRGELVGNLLRRGLQGWIRLDRTRARVLAPLHDRVLQLASYLLHVRRWKLADEQLRVES